MFATRFHVLIRYPSVAIALELNVDHLLAYELRNGHVAAAFASRSLLSAFGLMKKDFELSPPRTISVSW